MRTEDGRIIQECLNGETEAFGVLVDKYKEGIYAFVYGKMRSFQDAQDVTQEVFIEAYRSLRSLKRLESFSFWLYRIAYMKCAQWVRKKSKQVDQDFIEDQDPKLIDNFSMNSYQENQLGESVQESLDLLPEAYREVLMLHYFGGMNSNEIAEATGKSPNAIRMSLSRARARFREEMVDMINTAFEGQKLRVGFTFRVVEAVKRIKVEPTPSVKGLPWGLSLAIGLMLVILGIGQNVNISEPMEIFTASQLSGESKVLEAGEFPVDITDISNISSLSNLSGNGDGIGSSVPSLQNALFMAPQGEGDTWTKKAGMPTARSYLSSSVVDGKIYVIGGYTDKDILSTVEEYDPVSDKWIKKANMPTARCGLTTSVVNGKIYAIGGFSMNGPVTTIEEYDPATDKWKWKANMSGHRTYLSSSVANGKIYIIGGYFLGNPLSIVEEYDPIANKLSKKANMPTARGWLSSSAVNGKIYTIGGTEQQGDALSAVEEYDPMSDKWTKKTDMPKGKRNLSTSVVNGKIYAIGDDSDIYEYDPFTGIWTKKVDIPTARYFLSTSAVNGKIYAIGGTLMGNFPNPESTIEEYDTGFTDEDVDFKGKLPTKWGEMRTALNR